MPNTTTSAPFAAIERTSAQQIAGGVHSTVDQVVVQLRQSAVTPSRSSAIGPAPSELAEIIQLAAETTAILSRQPKEEAEQSAKVTGIIAAVVLVIVAVVIAAFTFGAGTPMVALAVFAASAIIAAAVAVAQGASSFANSALGAQLAALLVPVQAAVRNFESDHKRDPDDARRRALREIVKAMRELQRLAPQTERLTGPCLGDPPASYGALQRLPEALSKLIAGLGQVQTAEGSEWRPIATGLEGLHRIVITASQNLRPPVRPPK